MADEDLDLGDDESTPDGPAPVREAYKAEKKARIAAEKKAADAETRLAALETAQRSRDIAGFLTEHGANPKLAKFVQAEGDVTSDTVLKWLEAEGEALGWQAPADESSPGDEAANETARRITRTTSSAPPPETGGNWTPERVANASDADLEKAGWVETSSGPNRPRSRR